MIEDIEPYTELQPKLIDIYERARSSKDTRSFFTHLYRYLEIINSKSAYQRIVSDSLGAYYSDNEQADEIMGNAPNFASNMNSAPKEFNIEAVKWLTSSLISERNQSEPFYCWLRINLFYTFRKSSYDKRSQYNNWLTYKATNVMLKNEFTNIFKLNDDKNNHVFKTSLFKFCLEVSHPVIMDFINDMREYLQPDSKTPIQADLSSISNTITESDSNLKTPKSTKEQQAELIFHGLTTPIVRYRDYEYVFESLDDKYDPWKIISWCWTYMLDTEVSLSKLKDEADVEAHRGIKEALRKSPLFMKTKDNKGALSPFIKGLSKKYITLLKYTPLSNEELEIIENKAIDKRKI